MFCEGWGIQIPGVRISPLLVLSVVAFLPACTDEMPGPVCTESFAYVQVKVQTSGGLPVNNLTISDLVLRTGTRFPVPQIGLVSAPGMYVILDDSFRSYLRTSGDSVRVTGQEGGEVFSTDFVFDVPDGCHVRKVAGPDVIVP